MSRIQISFTRLERGSTTLPVLQNSQLLKVLNIHLEQPDTWLMISSRFKTQVIRVNNQRAVKLYERGDTHHKKDIFGSSYHQNILIPRLTHYKVL